MNLEPRKIGALLAALVVVAATVTMGLRSVDRRRPPRAPTPPRASSSATATNDASSDGIPARATDGADASEDDDLALAVPPIPSAPSAPSKGLRPITLARPVLDATAPPAVPLSPKDGEAEIALLEKAQIALVSDPPQALVLADEDARRFPRGPMREHAEVIAIAALQRTGNEAGAAARAKRFHEAYPRSTHLHWVDAIVARAPAP